MSEYLFDYKRFLLLNRKRIVWVILTTLICGALAGLAYYINDAFFSGPGEYRTASFYYITFDTEEFEAVHDYYNDYTWNDMLDSDLIAGRAAELTGLSKQEIAEATTIPTMSDIRMIWVYSDHEDEMKSKIIQDGIGQALAEFPDIQEGFKSIEKVDGPDTAKLSKDYLIKRVTIFGAVAGFIISLLVMLYRNGTDTKVYAFSDIKKITDKKLLGIISQDGVFLLEAKALINKVIDEAEGDSVAIVYADSFVEKCNKDFDDKFISRLEASKKIVLLKHEDDTFYEELKKYSSYIMLVEYGKCQETMVRAALDNASVIGHEPAGIILANMDRGFASLYYGKLF